MRARPLAVAAVTTLASIGAMMPGRASADANILVVDNTTTACSDQSGAGTAATPFCHISAAVAVAQPGQTVLVDDGSYDSGADFAVSGTPGAPITVRAAHPGQAHVRDVAPAFVLNAVHDIVIDGIDIAQSNSGSQGVSVTDSSAITLSHLSSQIVSITGAGSTGDSIVAGRLWSVAFSGGAHGNEVVSSIVSQIALTDSPGDDIVGNTLNGDDGTAAIDVAGTSTGTLVANNIVAGGPYLSSPATDSAISVSAGAAAQTSVHHNLIDPASHPVPYHWMGSAYQNPASFHAATGQGTADLYAAAQLDPNTWLPRRTSPAIDSADSGVQGEQSTDVYGNPRLDDPAVPDTGTGPRSFDDRGAVEFQGLPLAVMTMNATVEGNTATATTVELDASGSDWGFTPIASYTFTFGDGTQVTQSGPILTRTFPRSAVSNGFQYQFAYVTVTDQDGRSASSGHWAYEVMPQGCGPNPALSAIAAVIPLTVTFDASATKAGTNPNCNFNSADWYRFDFGDGTPATTQWGNAVNRHVFPAAGTYTVTLTSGSFSTNPGGVGPGTSVTTTVSVSDAAGITRLAGQDRYTTATEASQNQWAGGSADAVVLARGDAFPDALAGAPLAAHVHGPLLLTAPTGLTPATRDEITRVLGAGTGKTVYVLGGPTAVSPAVANALTRNGYKVVRYGGTDRYGTAVQIADKGLGHPTKVIVATGHDFPDALSAGPLASVEGAAILLSDDIRIGPATHAYLSTASQVTSVGAQADEALVATWLQSHDIPAHDLLRGGDRYSTSAQVAQRVVDLTHGASRFGIATGADYPDALSGGAYMSALGQPLILTDPATLPPDLTGLLTLDAQSLTGVTLFGGTKAVPPAIEQRISDLLSGRAAF